MNNLLKTSIMSSLLIIVLPFLQWKLMDLLTLFLMPFAWLIVYGSFIVIFILSIIRLFKKKDWKPLGIQMLAIVLWILIPFNQIVIEMDFKRNESKRNEVITKVNDGTFVPNVSYNPSLIHLPKEYKHLSNGGGDIVIEKQGNDYAVLFFTFRGILDNFSGIVYSPNDRKPTHSFGENFIEIKKLDDNWYFVASN
ncbi:hypothetical protein [Fictibacillus barbaricus]|uniref:Uncharacterized protein n=1 Tax=Fictibacillus barbaricus TaxID=182136 RepID=A0ABU1TWP9_9BACL|nr:hypothetical protein [Fictibacillus barbaricus]MDR7071651.1 hypothetical protein [Fictibacillus barbaricus]